MLNAKSLRSQRKSRGWTQGQLAEVAGVGLTAVKLAERGVRLRGQIKSKILAVLAGEAEPKPRNPRGFAAMPEERHLELARQGGIAARDSGNAHRFDTEAARRAGSKGGKALAEKTDMRELARRGGQKRAEQMRQRAQERREQNTIPRSPDEHAD